jgi:hypothetical protein|tara:strand:+ start:1992 stop:2651 length:660 start_codon:yes stop_codon:yes gene_type:complete
LKNLFKNFQTLIIIGLVIVIFLLRECKGKTKGAPIEPVTIVKIETKYDTIVETVETYIPQYRTKIKYKTKTVHDTVEVHDTVPVDTLSILEDYFATYAYTDTLKKDSVTFVINDTISQNKILSRGINYSLVYPTTIITTEREINKRELYIGFGLGGDKQQLSYVGSELLLRNKKQRIYGIGLGINNSFEPILTFKMSWKVKFPKKPKITIPIGIDPTIE